MVVQGTVTDIEVIHGRRHSYRYYPTVGFTTDDGRQMSVKTSRSHGYSVGQEVEVIYPPGNPEKAEIKGSDTFSLMNFWTIGIVFCFAMMLFFGFKWCGFRQNQVNTSTDWE